MERVAIINADYVEGEPATYRGCYLNFSNDSTAYLTAPRFNTGSIENDLAEAKETALAAGATTVLVTSLVDHYYQDRNNHQASSYMAFNQEVEWAIAHGYFYGRTGEDVTEKRKTFEGQALYAFDKWYAAGVKDAADIEALVDPRERW